MKKIFNYVEEGGVFINVADIPGYFAYNSPLGRKLDTTPPTYFMERRPDGKISISTERVFERTPFLEKLGLQVLNIENSG